MKRFFKKFRFKDFSVSVYEIESRYQFVVRDRFGRIVCYFFDSFDISKLSDNEFMSIYFERQLNDILIL